MATFDLLPAIDLRGGRVVRLRQGDFDRETTFGDDPVSVARDLADRGVRWLHVVDLDGARTGTPQQASVIAAIVEAVGGRVAVGGAGGGAGPSTPAARRRSAMAGRSAGAGCRSLPRSRRCSPPASAGSRRRQS